MLDISDISTTEVVTNPIYLPEDLNSNHSHAREIIQSLPKEVHKCSSNKEFLKDLSLTPSHVQTQCAFSHRVVSALRHSTL